jgi:hypothetical protein
MPSYTINTDTLIAVTIGANSTAQNVIEGAVFNALSGYRQQYNSTDLNDAMADFLATAQEGRGTPMVKQIRTHAAGLLAAGVAAPGGGGKFIAANSDNIDTLTVAAALTALQIGSLSLPAVDGTRWQINTPARASTLLTAINARITAVNGVRDASITAFQALTAQQKREFQFSSIVWP